MKYISAEEKRNARKAAWDAQRKGKLNPKPCEVCGAPAEKHHDDYRKPLEVRWLCRKHHREVDAKIRGIGYWEGNTKTYLLKFPDLAVYKRWKDASKKAGLSFAEFIRESVNTFVTGQGRNDEEGQSADTTGKGRTRLRGQRTRVAPGKRASFDAGDPGAKVPGLPGTAAGSDTLGHHSTCTCGVCDFRRKHLKK